MAYPGRHDIQIFYLSSSKIKVTIFDSNKLYPKWKSHCFFFRSEMFSSEMNSFFQLNSFFNHILSSNFYYIICIDKCKPMNPLYQSYIWVICMLCIIDSHISGFIHLGVFSCDWNFQCRATEQQCLNLKIWINNFA